MLVGLDDTDSPEGGCTTHFALQVAAALATQHGLVLRRLPALVRLNPNVPWKTRGNAAVCLDVGAGHGLAAAGQAPDGTVVALDPAAEPVAPSAAHEATVKRLVEQWCDLERQGTDPAAVFVPGPLPPAAYLDAVRGVVDPSTTRRMLEAVPGARYFALGDGRGIVGAAAAAAWPRAAATFELIAYRDRGRWGTRRQVDYASVEAMDVAFPETYNNVDREALHAAVAPATPCPVLLGIRATRPDRLEQAARRVVAGEAWAGHMVFETNQATDDHVVDRGLGDARPLETVRAEGTVVERPRRVKGGHVLFPIADEGGRIDCAAYEPTKSFRGLVGRLDAGDRVRVVGAVRADGRSVNLEKIELIEAAPRPRDARAPPAPGWYEVPVSARRHLARPLDPHERPPAHEAPKGSSGRPPHRPAWRSTPSTSSSAPR